MEFSLKYTVKKNLILPPLAGSRGYQPDDHWEHQQQQQSVVDRPASRTDVDSRRFGEIGRLNTRDWEERIQQV